MQISIVLLGSTVSAQRVHLGIEQVAMRLIYDLYLNNLGGRATQ